MGRKISVDSATMMNKGLGSDRGALAVRCPPERIQVLIHPQSIVHSLVEYVDGSVIAQLSNPDMRVPIAHALAYPERIESGVRPLELGAVAPLAFQDPEPAAFPASVSPTRRCGPAEARLPCSTQRTKSRSRRFSADTCA
jgi:1-deoxy-D-xylulose-5-phosphate reductoisomerase